MAVRATQTGGLKGARAQPSGAWSRRYRISSSERSAIGRSNAATFGAKR